MPSWETQVLKKKQPSSSKEVNKDYIPFWQETCSVCKIITRLLVFPKSIRIAGILFPTAEEECES